MKKKKILILQNILLHYRKALYNELSKYYDVTILHSGRITITDNDEYKEIIYANQKIGPFNIQHGVITEVRSDKYDVIIAMFDLRWLNNIISMYIHRNQTKFIWWGGWLTNNKLADWVRLFLMRKQYNSILYTQFFKENFIESGIDKNKLFVANNTFDVENREKLYNYPIKNTILFVGSLDKRKENNILIEAFKNIITRIPPDITLVLVGEGKEEHRLMELVESFKLHNKVIFAGRVTDNKNLIKYYEKAIVAVSFGQAGLSVLQSFGYGIPFITKKNAISGGEKTNIKHNYNGLFCDDQLDSLEKTLIRICNDIEYSRTLGKNAFNYYNEFCTIKQMSQGFIDAIES